MQAITRFSGIPSFLVTCPANYCKPGFFIFPVNFPQKKKKQHPRNHSKKTKTTMKSKQQDDTHSVGPCHICGGIGWPELIATYCMPIFVLGIRDDWICNTCHDENDTISLSMNISRDHVFDASNDITEYEIAPSTSGVQKTSMTEEHASHSLAKGGPQQYRWMYPFERFYAHLRTRSKIQGTLKDLSLRHTLSKRPQNLLHTIIPLK
ncbi:hypothetical protein K1719_036554 [Acacia pycnantha]|nr:hypothetical protein K1719_036554 [Acacia pycnantha]